MNIKKITGIFLTAVMLSSFAGCGTTEEKAAKKNIELPKEPVPYTKIDVTQVAEDLYNEEWYHEFCLAVYQGKTDFTVSKTIANKEISKALKGLVSDFPEVFWLGGSYSACTATGGASVQLTISPYVEEDKIDDMREELKDAAMECISNRPIADIETPDDVYETALYVHDYLAEHADYDYISAKKRDNSMAFQAYGCLVDGKCVCEGYAKAFTYIMNLLEIESGVCTGTDHAWNYIRIGDDYYWLDTTWDDNGKDILHDYFLITDEQLLRSRSFYTEQAFVPECTATEYNYFVKNGSYFDSYNEKDVISFVEDHYSDGRCEMMFENFADYDAAFKMLFVDDKIGKLNVKGKYNYTYTRNDNMFTIIINFS